MCAENGRERERGNWWLSPAILVDYRIPDVALDRHRDHGGGGTSGTYPGLDRFGRIQRQLWVDGGFAAGSGGNPNIPPLVETLYIYDKAGNRTAAVDARPGAAQPLSHTYGYDGLHRLVEALRGSWNGSSTSPSITQAGWSQRWHDGSGQITLDPLGNWTSSWLDKTGAGFGTGNADLRTHDWLNRITHREVGGVDLGDLSYDLAANLQEQVVEGTTEPTTYRHDAWNRLVEVRYDDVLRARYAYNALGWRTFKFADSTGTGGVPDGTMDQARLMYYSPDWRLLEERIDDAYASGDWDTDTWTPDSGNWTVADLDRHQQYHWGIRYIDDLVLHRIDRKQGSTAPDGDYADTNEGTWYHLTDAQFSTVCLITPSAAVAERVTYSAYGIARHHWPGDVDGDGGVTTSGTTSDRGIITTIFNSGDNLIGEAEYRAEADLDRDGDVDGSDRTLVGSTKAALPEGRITDASATGPDSQIGWDGYVFNAETMAYKVRHRDYEPPLGRFVERDLLDYQDSANLYQYAVSAPCEFLDPSGLAIQEYRLGNRCFLHVYKDGWSFFVFYSEEKFVGTVEYDCNDHCDGALAWAVARHAEREGQFDTLTEQLNAGKYVIEEAIKVANPALDVATAVCDAIDEPCTVTIAAAAAAALPGPTPIPGKKHFKGADAVDKAKKHLKKEHGIGPDLVRERLELIKKKAKLGPDDNVVIGHTGDCYCEATGEWIGSLTAGGAKRK